MRTISFRRTRKLRPAQLWFYSPSTLCPACQNSRREITHFPKHTCTWIFAIFRHSLSSSAVEMHILEAAPCVDFSSSHYLQASIYTAFRIVLPPYEAFPRYTIKRHPRCASIWKIEAASTWPCSKVSATKNTSLRQVVHLEVNKQADSKSYTLRLLSGSYELC